ncbi:MAG: efflux transporter outer membrane subunit, partial [Silvanigrellaceae bacterium]|nr:efflux transporter outer membrane subunit [Silvanigrellaceae bacterium]
DEQKNSNHGSKIPLEHIGWREFFTDQRLLKLIETALENNRDLKVAMLNIERDRAQYRIQRAELFPNIVASANQSRQRTQVFGANTTFTHQYNVTVGVTAYELDLFGRMKSLKTEALEQFYATVETQKSLQISLIAQVASSYLTLLADKDILKFLQESLEAQRSSHELVKKSIEQGIGSQIDLVQSTTNLERAKANVFKQRQIVSEDKNTLSLLIGSALSSDFETGFSLENQKIIVYLPENLNSEVLLKRPDILAAEHQLKAANAHIGAARAAFFPSISLTGSLGYTSTELSSLFLKDSQTWSFVPSIHLPIFSGGNNIAQLNLSETNKKIFITRYEKAIQNAFKEVADSLSAQENLEQQLKSDTCSLSSQSKYHDLTELRFKNGITPYISVLEARITLLNAKQVFTLALLARYNNMITLYKVLGGGVFELSESEEKKKNT